MFRIGAVDNGRFYVWHNRQQKVFQFCASETNEKHTFSNLLVLLLNSLTMLVLSENPI